MNEIPIEDAIVELSAKSERAQHPPDLGECMLGLLHDVEGVRAYIWLGEADAETTGRGNLLLDLGARRS